MIIESNRVWMKIQRTQKYTRFSKNCLCHQIKYQIKDILIEVFATRPDQELILDDRNMNKERERCYFLEPLKLGKIATSNCDGVKLSQAKFPGK